MSKVPAWKRLGLKVTEEAPEDTLTQTVHYDGSQLTNKLAKKLNKKRQLEETSGNEKSKKPPKKVKVPKAERGPPPEKDQFLYLKQFVHDKENWKFSKQKQNWLLKNIESIPDSYETELIAYFEDIQGGARTRVEEDLRAVINKWNEHSKKLEEKINAELYGEKTEETESSETTEKKTGILKNAGTSAEVKAEVEAKDSAPSREHAARCQKLLSAMLDEPVHLEGEAAEVKDNEEENNAEAAEPTGAAETTKQGEDDDSPAQEDNVIIEEVEVEEYDQRESPATEGSSQKEDLEEEESNLDGEKSTETKNEDVKKETKKRKAEKKEKKEKKSKKSKKEKK